MGDDVCELEVNSLDVVKFFVTSIKNLWFIMFNNGKWNSMLTNVINPYEISKLWWTLYGKVFWIRSI